MSFLQTADKVLKDIEPGGVVSNQLILFLKSIYVNNILWNECIENYPSIRQLMVCIYSIYHLFIHPLYDPFI